jgi:hypothetical protein
VLRPGEVTPNDLERAISGSSVARVHCASLAKATAASHSLIRPSISLKRDPDLAAAVDPLRLIGDAGWNLHSRRQSAYEELPILAPIRLQRSGH